MKEWRQLDIPSKQVEWLATFTNSCKICRAGLDTIVIYVFINKLLNICGMWVNLVHESKFKLNQQDANQVI